MGAGRRLSWGWGSGKSDCGKVPVTCQWTAPAAPCYPGARDWGWGPSAPHPAGGTCGHVRGARDKEEGRSCFSSETRLSRAATPTPGLSRRPRPSGLLRRKGGDCTHGGEAGRRERGGRILRPGRSKLEPAQARRRPPQPGGSGPASPPAACRPPCYPRVPARPPRAPRRSRSRTRPREQRARAPALAAVLGARRPGSRHYQALTLCLHRSAALRFGRRYPPHRTRRSEGCSARPSLSPPPPPTSSDCLSSAAVTTTQPSDPPPRPPSPP